jgi:hypothetical protein
MYEMIFEDQSLFNDVTEAYVFMIVFISYSVHSHDFSHISKVTKFHKYTSTGWVEEILSLQHFPKCKSS